MFELVYRRSARRALPLGRWMAAAAITLLVTAGGAFAQSQGADSQASPASNPQTVTLAIGYIPNIQFTPFYVAMDKGFYASAGVNLKIQYGFGIDIFSLLRAGRVDLGLSDSDQLIIAGAKGMPLSAVYQYYQQYPIAIVAKKGVVDTPGDFAGKTIGVAESFGTSYIGLQLFLNHYNLTGKVKIEKIGYTQIPALLAGKVDGAVVFTTNETVKLREMNVAFNEWDVSSFSDIVGSSIISSNATISEKRGTFARFLGATNLAAKWSLAHPDEAVAIAMKYIDGTDSSQIPFLKNSLLATLNLMNATPSFGTIEPAVYTDSIRILKDLGLIDQLFPASKILAPIAP